MNVWFILLFNILMCVCVCVCVFLNNVESCDLRSDHTIHNSIYLSQSYIGFRFWQPCSKVPTQLGLVWFIFFYHSIFITHHSFSVTHYSSLITHHFKYYTRLAPSFNIFHTICGPHTCHSLQVFFFFFFY